MADDTDAEWRGVDRTPGCTIEELAAMYVHMCGLRAILQRDLERIPTWREQAHEHVSEGVRAFDVAREWIDGFGMTVAWVSCDRDDVAGAQLWDERVADAVEGVQLDHELVRTADAQRHRERGEISDSSTNAHWLRAMSASTSCIETMASRVIELEDRVRELEAQLAQRDQR